MKRSLKFLLVLLLSLIAWLSFITFQIWNYADKDFSKPSDAIIVLGAAVNNDQPSLVFKERINHAITLYEQGVAPVIIFTGGYGAGESYAESEVAAAYALSNGVKEAALLIETSSRTTKENLKEAKQLMAKNELSTAVLVSDPLHMKRAVKMAGDLGMSVVSSPTPTSRYRSLKTKFGFLLREVYFYNHYLITKN